REPMHGVGRRRHQDDADAARALAQPAREHEAVFAGQPNIKQHQRGQLALQQLSQGSAAIGTTHAKVLPAKVVDKQLPLRRLILDDNDMGTMIHAAESPCPSSTAMRPPARSPVAATTLSAMRQNAIAQVSRGTSHDNKAQKVSKSTSMRRQFSF